MTARQFAIAALILGDDMSKEDMIPVYTIGLRTPEYSGVFMITHDLGEALELFSYFCIEGYNSEDDRIHNKWNDGEDLYIHKSSAIVSEYLSANCENVTREQAEFLASNHGFKLDEVYPWNNS